MLLQNYGKVYVRLILHCIQSRLRSLFFTFFIGVIHYLPIMITQGKVFGYVQLYLLLYTHVYYHAQMLLKNTFYKHVTLYVYIHLSYVRKTYIIYKKQFTKKN